VTYDGSHLTMDLFSTRLSPRWQRALDAVIAAVSLVTFAFMAWQAMTVVRTLMRNDQRSIALDIPIAIPHAALLVGFTLSALVVAVRVAFGRRIVKPMSADDVTSAI
jgi:TRAP-type transport system small permease protein